MRRLAVLVGLAVVTGCTSNATPRLLAEGATTPTTFDARLRVEPRSGLFVVPVQVGDAEVGFLLDSGAPTAITPQLRQRLDLPTRARTRARDARGTETVVDLVGLPDVRVAGVDFHDIAAVVVDLQAVAELRCLGVEGLLGANLMQQAAWELDLEEGSFRFANDVRTLGIPSPSAMARFITFDSGSPVLRPVLDGTPVLDMVLDTGANVGFVAPPAALPPAARASAVEVVGTSGAAALGYGSFDGVSWFARVGGIRIGELAVADQVVEFRREASLLGTRFLRDYLVTLDWRSRRVWFAPRPRVERPASSGFGFEVVRGNEGLMVSSVIVGTAAWQAGLRPGQTLLQIDGESVAPLEEERYCTFLDRGLVPDDRESLHVRWQGSDGERDARFDRTEVRVR